MLEKHQPIRRYDIDWLRILAVLLLIPFHSCLIFVMDPDSIMYIKDTEGSRLLDTAASFIHQFHMPLLFFLAGASSFFALGFRSGGKYVAERVKRLFIPALFGIAVLIPPMTYITRIARGEEISFPVHYTGFFRLNPDDIAGYYGTLTPSHLWFVIFLLVFSLAGLPLFLLLKSERSHGLVRGMARFFQLRCAVFLLAVPLALSASVDILGDKNPIVYFLVFFFGFLFMTDDRYQQAIDRDTPVALVLGILFEIIRQNYYPSSPEWSLPRILYGLMTCLNRWVWVLALLGLGRRFLNRDSSWLRYLSEAAFPVYVLHLPVNTLVGYWIIKLDVPVLVKYVLIVVLATAATFMLYEGFKRIRLLRFLLGMKGVKAAGKQRTMSV